MRSETLSEFVRRERITVFAAATVFSAVMLYAIFSVDPAYYYPRLITDQLLYFLKALSFIHTGSTEARAAVNVQPFFYTSGPALLRVPLIALFDDFDRQLRAVQLANLVVACVFATASAHLFSEVIPRAWHKFAVLVAFASQLLNPVWVTNILSPLADLPFAAASLACILLLRRIVLGTRQEHTSVRLKFLFAVAFTIAFLCRYTALGILVYAFVLYRRRSQPSRAGGSTRRRVMFLSAGAVLALIVVNLRTMIFGYLWQPVIWFKLADKTGMILNLISVSIPSQIIPGFALLFAAPPAQDPFHPRFATTPFDTILFTIGILVTAIIATGMWSSRRNRLAEIVYVLLPVPVFAVVVSDTTRYLFSSQPFYWIFAYLGAVAIARGIAPSFRITKRIIVLTVPAAVVMAAAAFYVRTERLNQGRALTISSFSLGQTRGHSAAVASTYRGLRNYLESLPRNQTLVINDRQRTGQWTAIAGVPHYQLDSGIVVQAQRKQVYLIVDCPTPSDCRVIETLVKHAEQHFGKYGSFKFDQVFALANEWSAARVYRVRTVN